MAWEETLETTLARLAQQARQVRFRPQVQDLGRVQQVAFRIVQSFGCDHRREWERLSRPSEALKSKEPGWLILMQSRLPHACLSTLLHVDRKFPQP